QIRAPEHTAGRGPQSMAAIPAVVRKGINSLPMKVGPGNLPMLAILPGPQQECTLRRPHEQEHLAVLHLELLDPTQYERSRTGRLVTPRFAHDGCRLNRLER